MTLNRGTEDRKKDRKRNDVMVIEEEEKQVNKSRQTIRLQQTDASGFSLFFLFIFILSQGPLEKTGSTTSIPHRLIVYCTIETKKGVECIASLNAQLPTHLFDEALFSLSPLSSPTRRLE